MHKAKGIIRQERAELDLQARRLLAMDRDPEGSVSKAAFFSSLDREIQAQELKIKQSQARLAALMQLRERYERSFSAGRRAGHEVRREPRRRRRAPPSQKERIIDAAAAMLRKAKAPVPTPTILQNLKA